MQKILLSKNTNLEEIKDEILNINLDEVDALTLIIPKNSELKKHIENFYKLKEFIKELGKDLIIESVDDEVLNLVKEANIKAVHPLFSGDRESHFKKMIDVSFPNNHSKKQINFKKDLEEEKEEIKTIKKEPEEPEEIEEKEVVFEPQVNYFEEKKYEEKPKRFNHKYDDFKNSKGGFKKFFKILLWSFGVIIVLFGGFKLLTFISNAQIILKLKNNEFNFNDTISISKNVSAINIKDKIIPAQVFEYESNLTQTFKASGKKYVEEKASGIITIYNNYSSDPQTLVANTRFEAPNGLIYRLKNQVVVPGAQVKEGKINPSSINAEIVADKPGDDYNSGPISRLTIPGFKGTPKYNGFYGEIKGEVKGGFVGEKLVPQTEDINSAKEKTKEVLEANLKNVFSLKRPADFKFINDPEISITNLSVNTTTDDKGNFAVFASGKIKSIGFREKDIYDFLLKINNASNDQKIVNLKLNYLNPNIDLVKGVGRFNLQASGGIVYDLNESDFKNKILGKDLKEAENEIKSFKEIEGAKIIIWPKILNKIPGRLEKINLKIEY
jgi:hypothetical protein